MNKIPNWLRYILAIPSGITLAICATAFIYFSTRLVSDSNSLNMKFVLFALPNIAIPIFFIIGVYEMLPRYKKRISGTISVILAMICIAELFLHLSPYDTAGIMASAVTLLIMSVVLPKDKDETMEDDNTAN